MLAIEEERAFHSLFSTPWHSASYFLLLTSCLSAASYRAFGFRP